MRISRNPRVRFWKAHQTEDGKLKIDAPCAVDAAFEQATKDLKKLQKPGKSKP